MFEWVIEGQLVRGQRPGYTGEQAAKVPQAVVDAWIGEAKEWGIQSIICLLGEDQLDLYAALPTDLVSYNRRNGFSVEHILACDHLCPPLSEEQLQKVWQAYERLPKPVLVHCSAGVDRTGAAIRHIEQHLKR